MAQPTVGPPTLDNYLKSFKQGNTDKAVDQISRTTPVQYGPQDSRYWQTRDGSQGIDPQNQQTFKANTTSSAAPIAAEGATMFSAPISIEHSVRALSKIKPESPSFADTLTPGAKRVYLERATKFQNKNPAAQVASTAGGLFKEAFADPLSTMIGGGLESAGIVTPRQKLREQEKIMETKIDSLVTAKKFDEANSLYDEYMKYKIGNMSDLELQRAQTEHPVLFGVTEGLAVGSMQYLALRNAPLLKTMGDSLKAKTAAKLATLTKGSKAGQAIATSKYGKGLLKMSEELVGDLPTDVLMPLMNFDYENRPLSELPAQSLKDLSIIIPSALTLHTAGYLAGGVLQAAGRILTMSKALRIPLSSRASEALEKAAMGEEDNAFTRILDAVPEDRDLLREHFTNMRSTIDGENRMLALNRSTSPSAMRESRLAKHTGPDLPDMPQRDVNTKPLAPRMLPTGEFDASAALPTITPGEKAFMTKTVKQPKVRKAATARVEKSVEGMKQFRAGIASQAKETRIADDRLVAVEAKDEFDRMVTEVRSFREGLRQGGMQTKDMIRERQVQIENFIQEKLPMKYRGRALSLVKRAATQAGLDKAIGKLDEIVRQVDLGELKLGVKRANIRRSTRHLVEDILTNPAPEIDFYNPLGRSVWFNKTFDMLDEKSGSVIEDVTGKKPSELMSKAASSFVKHIQNKNEPLVTLPQTWKLMKRYPKIVSERFKNAGDDLAEVYNRFFNSKQDTEAFHKYAILRQMRTRAENGISNPAVTKMGIPNNPGIDWIEDQLLQLDNPRFQAAQKAFQAWDERYILENLVESGRITRAVADEWKTKYPDHVTFMYDKYTRSTDGNPFTNKTFNFTARDYLSPMKGSDGLELRPNLFDTRMRSSVRAIGDLQTDMIAQSMREEMGLKPLKIVKTPTGKKRFQALVKGELFDFDLDDINAETIPGLKDQRILFSQVDGQAFLIPKEISDVVTNEGMKLSGLTKVVARSTALWRNLTTTYNPIFAVVTNPAKDIQNSMLLTEHGTTEFLSSYLQSARDLLASLLYKDPKAIANRLKLDEDVFDPVVLSSAQKFKNWMARKIGTQGFEKFTEAFDESGTMGGYYSYDAKLKDEVRTIDSLKKWVTGADPEYSLARANTKFIDNAVLRTAKRTSDGISIPFASIREAGEFFEKLPRMAEFRLTLDKTGDALQAATRGSDISVDFHQKGETLQFIRAWFPFSNAGIQGTTNLLSAATGTRKVSNKAMKGPIAAAAWGVKLTSQTIVPAVGLWFLRKKMGVEDRIDKATRDGYWVIPTGQVYIDENGNRLPVTVTWRKGEAAQMITPLVDGLLNKLYSQDPTAFNNVEMSDIARRVAAAFTPFIRVPIEVWANKSFYYNQPIVPDNLKERPREVQSFRNTTWAGNALGDMLGISPIEGDFILRNMAPGPATLYRGAVQDPEAGKSPAMTALEILNLVQTPTTFFETQGMEKERRAIIEQMKNMGRAKYSSQEEMVQAQQRLMKDLYKLSDLIEAKDAIRSENPMVGIPINFINADPAGRKAMWNQLTPEERNLAIEKGYVTKKKK